LGRTLARAVKSSGGEQTIIEQVGPSFKAPALSIIDQTGNHLRAVLENVIQFEERKATEPDGWLIRQRIGVGQMMIESRIESRDCLAVETQDKLFGGRRVQNFIEE